MRDIKFRAWDRDKLKMFSVATVSKYYGVESDDAVDDKGNVHIYRHILMQYTGLKDKNGKELYDSDFFKDKNGVIYLVDHDEDGWIFKNGDVGYRPSTFRTSIPYSLDGEFIGNIYENPELVEK